MALSRREFLKLSGVSAATLAATSCSVVGRELAQMDLPASLAVPIPGTLQGDDGGVIVNGGPPTPKSVIWRFLNRGGYGPRPGDQARVEGIGFEAYLEEQLHPENIEDTTAELIVGRLATYQMDPDQLIDYEPLDVAIELGTATISRALTSRRQLYETMVEFWSDHFNIYLRKNQYTLPLKVVDDRDAIRPHAMGKFRDLLGASAASPAMLVYLDNVSNHKDSTNENYARELMELHTLGVNAGYTQEDVQEVARAFTGWDVNRQGSSRGQFHFDAGRHDDGQKIILGKTFPAGLGAAEVPAVLDLLAGHPATADFISSKLVRRFVAEEPPIDLVGRVAKVFRQTDGDIKSMMREIFLSDEFAAAPPKLKRPYTFLLSSIRALNGDLGDPRVLARWLDKLGQPLFQWAAPDGYPDYSAAWAANLLPRWNFSVALLAEQISGVTFPLDPIIEAEEADTLKKRIHLFSELIFGGFLDDDTENFLFEFTNVDTEPGPEADIRLREAIALMLSSPAFQWI